MPQDAGGACGGWTTSFAYGTGRGRGRQSDRHIRRHLGKTAPGAARLQRWSPDAPVGAKYPRPGDAPVYRSSRGLFPPRDRHSVAGGGHDEQGTVARPARDAGRKTWWEPVYRGQAIAASGAGANLPRHVARAEAGDCLRIPGRRPSVEGGRLAVPPSRLVGGTDPTQRAGAFPVCTIVSFSVGSPRRWPRRISRISD